MKMKKTSKALLFLLTIYSLGACTKAIAENAANLDPLSLLNSTADSAAIDNSKLINPEGNLLLNFEAKASYVHPISLEQLKKAKTLSDLMRAYPSDYIDEYKEVRLSFNGIMCKSENEILSDEQKNLIQRLKVSDNFNLEVDFKSKGVLDQKLIDKKMDFEISVIPTSEAYYTSGESAMNSYFRNEIIKKAKSHNLLPLVGMGIAFTINEDGKVISPHLEDCSPHKQLSDFLIKTAENMPAWTPATNAKGENITQDFYLEISTFDGC
jgi:hypothetical protein